MMDRTLIQKLHDKGIIDKRNVFWWQFGFEGRKVLSEEQFREGLRDISYWAKDPRKKDSEQFQVNLRVWTNESVPVVIKEVEISGMKIPCFITCCPMSHEGSWRNLQTLISLQLPIEFGGIYNQPHIRGVAVETTKDFLFWYPFLSGDPHNYYQSYATHLNKSETWLIPDPVHPSRFYTNLIKKEWHKGKRPQKAPLEFPFSSIGLNFQHVPYFDFNPSQNHITTYPLPVFEDAPFHRMKAFLKQNPSWTPEAARSFAEEYPWIFKLRKRLDLPIILMSSHDKAEILGAGSLIDDSAFYWKLDYRQHSLARKALKDRLGLDSSKF